MKNEIKAFMNRIRSECGCDIDKAINLYKLHEGKNGVQPSRIFEIYGDRFRAPINYIVIETAYELLKMYPGYKSIYDLCYKIMKDEITLYHLLYWRKADDKLITCMVPFGDVNANVNWLGYVNSLADRLIHRNRTDKAIMLINDYRCHNVTIEPYLMEDEDTERGYRAGDVYFNDPFNDDKLRRTAILNRSKEPFKKPVPDKKCMIKPTKEDIYLIDVMHCYVDYWLEPLKENCD